MSAQFLYLVVRERRVWVLDLTEVRPIAAYFDKDEAERHARAVQDAAAAALGELQSYRQAPPPRFVLPLDPTCVLTNDTDVGYSVEAVPLVSQSLDSEGLHPWMPAEPNPAEGITDGFQTALGAAFARLKQGGASVASA
jgi:hypothetical protein